MERFNGMHAEILASGGVRDGIVKEINDEWILLDEGEPHLYPLNDVAIILAPFNDIPDESFEERKRKTLNRALLINFAFMLASAIIFAVVVALRWAQ